MVLLPRRTVLVAGLALAAFALAVLTGCGSGSSNGRRRAQAHAAGPTGVTVQAGKPGRAVPFGFLGLSLEYRSVEVYAGADPSALDPVFVQLVRNLVPGQAPVLRIGGDSADRTWWPTPGLARPPGVKFAITDRWLAVTRALAGTIAGASHPRPQPRGEQPGAGRLGGERADRRDRAPGRPGRSSSATSRTCTRPSLGTTRRVAGACAGRPRSYDMSGLIGDFARFAPALPRSVLAGPSLGAPGWTRDLGRFLAAEPRVGLVTLHRYPLQLCYTPRSSPRYPTLAHLLSPAASIGLADSYAPYVGVAHARGGSLRVDELNSVSCGAVPAVSKTFASALWALNTMFEMVRVGVHGVNFHTFPGAGYELFRISRPSGRWQAQVAPEYYGLEMFARAAPPGSRLLAVSKGSDRRSTPGPRGHAAAPSGCWPSTRAPAHAFYGWALPARGRASPARRRAKPSSSY